MARALLAGLLLLFGCTFPTPNIDGDWVGSGPNQIAITIDQQGSRLRVSGQIARVGMLKTGGAYLLPIDGTGEVAADSTVVLRFSGRAGQQELRAKLLPGETIAGILTGGPVDGEQKTTLRRRPLH